MDRRAFIGSGLSAALFAGCLSARGVRGLAPKPTRRTIAVGAERPFRVLHASDTHVALMDDFDRADASRAAYETMRPKTFGYHAEEYLVGTFGYARDEGIPLLHTGDLIDYIGKANLAAAKRAFADADAMACAGNHEWEYLLRVEDPPVMRPRYYDEVSAAFPNDMTVASRVLNGVNFVLLDNADYQIPPDRATRETRGFVAWMKAQPGIRAVSGRGDDALAAEGLSPLLPLQGRGTGREADVFGLGVRGPL